MALVHGILCRGAEYEKTHDLYARGIRSTPTMISTNRMVIGTFPCQQVRAIFRALVDLRRPEGAPRLLENWVEGGS